MCSFTPVGHRLHDQCLVELVLLSCVGDVKVGGPDDRGAEDGCMVGGGGAIEKVDIQINPSTWLCAPPVLIWLQAP